MKEKPKRLKRNVSFSEHEKDIYDYLNAVGNASALIKRLVYNHMIMEQGIAVPTVVQVGVEQSNVIKKDETAKDETAVTIENTNETEEETIIEETVVEETVVEEVKEELTPEEIENMKLAMDLEL